MEDCRGAVARRAPAWAPALPAVPASGHQRGGGGRLAFSPFGLQQLHPLLQLAHTRLQVAVEGLCLTELAVGRRLGEDGSWVGAGVQTCWDRTPTWRSSGWPHGWPPAPGSGSAE